MVKFYNDIPKLVAKLTRNGKNRGIGFSFAKLFHGFFKIQDMFLVKYYNRGQCDPDIKPLIDLLALKLWVMTDVMKTSLPEECEIDGLKEYEYPDFDWIKYEDIITAADCGATRNQNDHDFALLQQLYDIVNIMPYATGPVNAIPGLNIQEIYNRINLFDLQIDKMGTSFGNIYDEIAKPGPKDSIFHATPISDIFQFSLAIFNNILFLYTKISETIATNSNSKIFTLRIDTNLQSDKEFVAVANTLFLPLTSEDVDACHNLNADIDAYIDNDTRIALHFLESTDVKYIFIFRLISNIYEAFLGTNSINLVQFYNTKEVIKIYTLINSIHHVHIILFTYSVQYT